MGQDHPRGGATCEPGKSCSWESEKQHRDLVFDNCGPTLTAPRDACPVCAGPVSGCSRVGNGT